VVKERDENQKHNNRKAKGISPWHNEVYTLRQIRRGKQKIKNKKHTIFRKKKTRVSQWLSRLKSQSSLLVVKERDGNQKHNNRKKQRVLFLLGTMKCIHYDK